ncbi:hypothetical protein RJ639_020928 [Escallonia herrerae]|uniref:Uncharacterized protein n=1 Tax=Escallonia herrerae TaxID=1293975 RepID=A0AA88V577_9ASTE|nr:hypothetical protein RJ639_020928 [Escallonia herrerae]
MLCDANSVTEVNSSSSHDSIIPCAGNIQNCFDSSCLVVELQLIDNDDHVDFYSYPSQAPTPISSENDWFAEDDLWISTHSILYVGLQSSNWNCKRYNTDVECLFFDRRGYSSRDYSSAMVDFSIFVNDAGLLDLPLTGAKYTWTNNERNPIMSRLDRFFITADWENHFKNVAQKALPRVIFDHAPIILDVNSLRKAKTYFKFENMWSMVEFGNMNSRKSHIMSEIDTLNNKEEELLLSNKDLQRRLSLQLEFHQITKMGEISWRQKSRETWLKLGDENSRYFHMMASMKRRRNFISAIYVDNSMVDDLDTIKSKTVQFYQNLLIGRFEHRPLLDGIHFNSLSPEKVANLESPFIEDEVWSTVKGCKADKAPGLDGFNFGFIHAYWDIIKFEVLQFVNEFHDESERGRRERDEGAAKVVSLPSSLYEMRRKEKQA